MPFSNFKIEMPPPDPNGTSRLLISETRGGATTSHVYSHNPQENSWSLIKGNGLQDKTRVTQTGTISGDRIVTETVKDDSGKVAYIVQTTYHTFPWGEDVIEIVEDPDGAALTTTMSYFENPSMTGSYERIESRINPDGSWVRYEYDNEGRTILKVRSWLDAPIGASALTAHATYYDYTPVDPDDNGLSEFQYLPRTVTERIEGNITARTYYAYWKGPSGERIEIIERCVKPTESYGDVSSQRTITTYYPSGDNILDSGRIKSAVYSDGLMDTYTYEYGSYESGHISIGAGRDICETVVHGTVNNPEGIAYKTTKETSIQDEFGNTVLQETHVYTGEGYQRIQWTEQTYDDDGHVTKVSRSDGTQTDSTWGCCSKESDTDARGIERNYSYDELNRLEISTKQGTNADITTSYTYDAIGRRLTETVSAGELSQVTRNVYDLAGRRQSMTGPAGFSTVYAYSRGGSVATVTRPGNVTEISERYIDGRTKSITGTGVIPRYYSYGINADGTRWTQVNTGNESSPMWEKTTTDMVGRTIKVERPGFTNVEITANYYDHMGRLIKTTSPGQADTLYAYDELGNQVQSGLDVDNNGSLELASNDRITESETLYTPVNESWWQSAAQRIYATESDGTGTTVSTQKTRLTGLGAGGMTNEAVSIDIHGNQSVTQTFINREAKTETRVIDHPDSPINSISVSTNGVLTSSQTKTGINISYSYDALGRQTGINDPRTGLTTTHYNDKGQVDYIEDPANNRINYAYNPDTGRKSADTNALNKITRYEYNSRGQIIRTWGDATYPVQYVYDNYGRMSEMRTYRGGTNWNSETWPTGAEGTADVTKWHYPESTGLLIGKEDAAGKSVSYTYGAGESLATRTWTRTDSGNPVITAYSYDDATGELTGIAYSDATPNISIAYDRLGRPKIVTDAVGTHTFAFNSHLQLESETISGIYNKMINRTYANSGVIGRASGFTLGANYNVTYGYENIGRFHSVSWSAGGISKTATYSYVQNSDLINQLTTNTGQKTTYSYEPQRDLRTQVKNEFGGSLISQYDYGYDALGRRNSVANSGLAFSHVTNAFNLYDYNDRNEIIESARYLGANISEISNPVQSEYRSYNYDPIGNRKQSAEGTAAQTYAANMLNQYSQITTNNGQQMTDSLTYDPDGNLTSMASSDGTTNFTYNAENRLIAVSPQILVDGDKRIEFTYDYMGRRVQKKIYSWQTDHWALITDNLYIYDGWNLICEIISENGQPAKNKYYVWGLDLSQSLQGTGGVGGLLASVEPASGSTYYYLYDVNGNVGQLVAGADGSIAAQYEYDPYGNAIVAVESVANDNPFRFSTKYWDGEVGLYYYGYRYYLPELGRWVNRDPIGERGGVNLYTFVSNVPTSGFDLFGLNGLLDWLKETFAPTGSFLTGAFDNSSFGYLGQIDRSAWIEAHYPNWLKEIKRQIQTKVFEKIDSLCRDDDRTKYELDISAIDVQIITERTEMKTGKKANECKHGDAPQTWHEAEFFMNVFKFSIDGGIAVIEWYPNGNYSWYANLVAIDDMGLDASDPVFSEAVYDFFGLETMRLEDFNWFIKGPLMYNFPDRDNMVRGSWTTSGAGVCCSGNIVEKYCTNLRAATDNLVVIEECLADDK